MASSEENTCVDNEASSTTEDRAAQSGENSEDEMDQLLEDLFFNSSSVTPYRFEPYLTDASDASSSESDDSIHPGGDPQPGTSESSAQDGQPPDPPADGLPLEWCQCGRCIEMHDRTQNVCCVTVQKLQPTMEGLSCITEHEGMEPICLNRYSLQVAYFHYRQYFGHYGNQFIHERYRYTAYRQFVRWHWGYLGKDIRVPLPSCVVNNIRETFPSENYTGFRYPALD